MIFLVGNLYLMLCQYWHKRQRRTMISQVLRNNIRHASVIFQRTFRPLQTTGDSYIQSFTNVCSDNIVQSTVYTEAHKHVSAVTPKLVVNLTKWTSYLDQQDTILQVRGGKQTCHILILSSSVSLEDSQSFVEDTLSIPQGLRIKLKDHAVPLAWKSGNPFGIITSCSEEDLVILASAFMENRLQTDDLLRVDDIISVDVTGSPACLLRTVSNGGSLPSAFPVSPISSKLDVNHTIPDHTSLVSNSNSRQKNDSNQYCEHAELENQSNESLASSLCGDDVISFGTDDKDSLCCNTEPQDGAGEAMATPSHRRSDVAVKPPNILVYCGKKDTARRFENVKGILQQCVNTDCYVIYLLRHEQVLTTPWSENTALLVISSDKVYDGTDQAFLNYFKSGGTVVCFSCQLDELFVSRSQVSMTSGVLSLEYGRWTNVNLICGQHVYKNSDSIMSDTNLTVLGRDSKTGHPVILEACHYESCGLAVLSQVNLDKDPVEMAISGSLFTLLKTSNSERFEVLTDVLRRLDVECSVGAAPCLTPAVLYSTSQNLWKKFMASFESRLKNQKLKSRSITLHFIQTPEDINESITSDYLPVLPPGGSQENHFDFSSYRQALHTKTLGHVVIYSDVIATTMSVFEGIMFLLPEDVGVIAVARQQVSGKGRGGNAWLSPVGCAMFSLHVRIPLGSKLGQACAYLQHIAALAVVEAVRSTPGYEELNLRIKWPNDIYFGRNIKLGGVIVNSSVMGNLMHANIGVGFNVKNRNPTICINDLVEQHNLEHGTQLDAFVTEDLIGRTVTQTEKLIDLFQQQGIDAFLHLYYRRWLHSEAVIHLEREGGPEARVLGLDEHGYLLIRTQDGSTVSAQPDNNSFDMMKNLLVMKVR